MDYSFNQLILHAVLLSGLISIASGEFNWLSGFFCNSHRLNNGSTSEQMFKQSIRINSLEKTLRGCQTDLKLTKFGKSSQLNSLSKMFEQKLMECNQQSQDIRKQLELLRDQSNKTANDLKNICKKPIDNETNHYVNTILELRLNVTDKDKEIERLKVNQLESQINIERLKQELNDFRRETRRSDNKKDKEIKLLEEQKEQLHDQVSSHMTKIANLQNQVGMYTTCCQARSCLTFGQSTDVHVINIPDAEPMTVLCNGVIAGPGWTVIQRRIDGSVNFFRNWTEYQNGFGDPNGEFFLGLEKLHRITSSEQYELYIHLESFENFENKNEQRFARYDKFEVGSEAEDYVLKSLGAYNGTAGDNLSENINQKFSTYDHDRSSGNCANELQSGWWYTDCGLSNLNGKYLLPDDYEDTGNGIFWDEWLGWDTSLKSVVIMIRPKNNNL